MTAHPTPALNKPARRRRLKRRRLVLTLLTIPFVLHVFAFCYVPLLGWALAFFNYKPGLALDKLQFVGLKYFKLIGFYIDDIKNALRNTMAMSGLSLITSWLPMLLAILLTELRFPKYRKALQTVMTLPNFISWVIVFSLCFGIFSTEGVYNRVMMGAGLITQPNGLLSNPNTSWLFMLGLGLWKGLGWNAIIYLAAIAGIDQSLYEAATVDGAGRARCIWHITIPGILPTFIVLLLLQVGNLLSVGFEQYLVFTNTMNASALEVLDIYTYRIGIQTQDYSFATAVGIIRSGISIALIFIVNAFAKRVRGESII